MIKTLIPALIAVALLGCEYQPANVPQPINDVPIAVESDIATYTMKVVGVVDGDTIDCLTADNEQIRIRVNAIDTPERGQPFGDNAKQFVSDEIFGKTVTITGDERDRYGRLIADVHYGEKWLSLELVKAGLAWHYKKYSSDKLLADAEIAARESIIGLWGDPRHVAPWDWRKLSKEEMDKLR